LGDDRPTAVRPTRLLPLLLVPAALAVGASPAGACAGLIGPAGSVELLRTSTLAAHVDGVEHYVTSFEFAGGGAELGSIVPLPGVPTKVERGGDWTLQRLQREVQPVEALAVRAASAEDDAAAPAEVLLEARIDALDLTVLRGGGTAVGDWARQHGFRLTPDAPEVLDFYAQRSPVFLAARFDATAARGRDQQIGTGTPVHLTIPTDEPWVPLRILGLGRGSTEVVEADVFLLTDRRPSLLAGGPGLDLERRERAGDLLLDDLRSDAGMGWVPEDAWLTHLALDVPADDLDYDLAVATEPGARPSARAAGLLPPLDVPVPVVERTDVPWLPGAFLAGLAAVIGALAVYGRRRATL
jgi:hypothetical protein